MNSTVVIFTGSSILQSQFTFYAEQGNAELSFVFRELVKLKSPDKNWPDAEPINLSMFTG